MGIGRSLPVTAEAADVLGLSRESHVDNNNTLKKSDTREQRKDSTVKNGHCDISGCSENGNRTIKPLKRQSKRLWIWPVLSTIFPPITCITSYAIAVGLDHVEPIFPSISMVGSKPPESCVFGVFLNIFTLVAGTTMYIRYRQISLCEVKKHCRYLFHFNKLTFGVGILAVAGAIVVAHFQVENVLVVHYVGSVSLFSFGMLYFMFQTVLSFICTEIPGSNRIIRISRLIMSCLHIILFTMCILSGVDAIKISVHINDWTFWLMYPDPEMYLLATISEWILAFVLVAYSLTFIPEYRHIKANVDITIPLLSFGDKNKDYNSNNREEIHHL